MADHRRELIELAEQEEAEDGPFDHGYYGQTVVDTTRKCIEVWPDECEICEAVYEGMRDE